MRSLSWCEYIRADQFTTDLFDIRQQHNLRKKVQLWTLLFGKSKKEFVIELGSWIKIIGDTGPRVGNPMAIHSTV